MIMDKLIVLNTLFDEMEGYRGEQRRIVKTRAGTTYHNFMRLSTCVDIFYLRNCPCQIVKELNELISEDTPCTKLFIGLKERLLSDELIHDFVLPSITMGELIG